MIFIRILKRFIVARQSFRPGVCMQCDADFAAALVSSGYAEQVDGLFGNSPAPAQPEAEKVEPLEPEKADPAPSAPAERVSSQPVISNQKRR